LHQFPGLVVSELLLATAFPKSYQLIAVRQLMMASPPWLPRRTAAHVHPLRHIELVGHEKGVGEEKSVDSKLPITTCSECRYCACQLASVSFI
jgi:hypothetical protein